MASTSRVYNPNTSWPRVCELKYLVTMEVPWVTRVVASARGSWVVASVMESWLVASVQAIGGLLVDPLELPRMVLDVGFDMAAVGGEEGTGNGTIEELEFWVNMGSGEVSVVKVEEARLGLEDKAMRSVDELGVWKGLEVVKGLEAVEVVEVTEVSPVCPSCTLLPLPWLQRPKSCRQASLLPGQPAT